MLLISPCFISLLSIHRHLTYFSLFIVLLVFPHYAAPRAHGGLLGMTVWPTPRMVPGTFSLKSSQKEEVSESSALGHEC